MSEPWDQQAFAAPSDHDDEPPRLPAWCAVGSAVAVLGLLGQPLVAAVVSPGAGTVVAYVAAVLVLACALVVRRRRLRFEAGGRWASMIVAVAAAVLVNVFVHVGWYGAALAVIVVMVPPVVVAVHRLQRSAVRAPR